jgi:hypothetical protein
MISGFQTFKNMIHSVVVIEAIGHAVYGLDRYIHLRPLQTSGRGVCTKREAPIPVACHEAGRAARMVQKGREFCKSYGSCAVVAQRSALRYCITQWCFELLRGGKANAWCPLVRLYDWNRRKGPIA